MRSVLSRVVCTLVLVLAPMATPSMADNVENSLKLSTFKVIGTVGKDPAVKMGVRVEGGEKDIYLLEKSPLDPILYVGSAPAYKNYHYVMIHDNGTVIDQEEFLRQPSTASLHEFYGRRMTTIHQAAETLLPNLFADAKRFERLDSSRVHPKDEIPTIHIKATPNDLKDLYDNYLEDFAIPVNMSHISGSDFLGFEGVKFQLGGQTSRLFEKLSFNVHIPKESNLSLGGYRRFKLRAAATDPTFMREKLYYDVLEAAGLPASQASFVRLFVNEEPMGLYIIIDNYKNPFLKNVFGGGQKYKHGALYQGDMPENPMAPGKLGAGANLAYLGPDPSDYAVGNSSLYKVQQEASKGDNGLQSLIEFMEFVHNPRPDDDEENATVEKAWEKRLDVQLFLKNIAFEVLMGHVDGYLGAAHNFFLYQEPKTGKFHWISADLDQTMGNAMIPLRAVTELSNGDIGVLDRFGLLNDSKSRPLMQQIMNVPMFRIQFQQILKDIHAALYAKPVLIDRLQSLKAFIQEDVAWDAKLRRLRSSAFANDQIAQKHRDQIQQKILQLPLGPDFLSRIGAIDFEAAIDGPIENHPSLMPLREWVAQTGKSLAKYIAKANTNT